MRRLGVMLSILIRTALRGLQTSPVTSGIAVLTITVALLLVGAFLLLVSNMEGVLDSAAEELGVVAYLDADLSLDESRALAARALTVEGVESVQWVSREEALERFRASVGGAELLAGLEENPLPASLEIGLLPAHRTPAGLGIVRESLGGLPGIAEVAEGEDWLDGYARAVSLVSQSAIALGAILAVAALLIVANTIRLALYSREDEIEIYSLVGASRTFVGIPFLLEGSIQGGLGGLLAVGMLYGMFGIWAPELQYGLELLIGHVPPHFLSGGQMAGLAGGGSALGLVGATMALLGSRR